MDWRSCWSSRLPSADLRIGALPFGSAWVIGTSHAQSQYGAVVLYEDCVLWLEDVIKRHVDRLAVVNAFPAGRPMALPAPTKSIVFPLLRNSTLVTKCRVPRGFEKPSFVIIHLECPTQLFLLRTRQSLVRCPPRLRSTRILDSGFRILCWVGSGYTTMCQCRSSSDNLRAFST